MAKIFTGTAGNNTLRGSWGDDSINGGLGADTMYGGGGNDIYIVDNPGDIVREPTAFRIYNDTAIELASVTGAGVNGNGHSGENAVTISGNGNLVGFYSAATNLFASDANLHAEFDLKNMTTGSIVPVHTDATNTPPASGLGGGPDLGYSAMHMTPDGHYLVFSSTSVGLMPGVDDTTDGDIFVKDLLTGAITIESEPYGAGVSNGYHSTSPDISNNGRYVVFTATDNLVSATDTNGISDTDVFWRDRQTGELHIVSQAANISGAGGNSDSGHATVTNDGQYVLYDSTATNLAVGASIPVADTNALSDIFLTSVGGDTYRMSDADAVTQANGASYDASITPDGRYMVFTSGASNLIGGDVNSSTNIYRKALVDADGFLTLNGEVVRVNTTSTGVLTGSGQHAQITPDGRYVVFESTATTLVTVAGDSNALTKIFVKDLVTGDIEMVSRTSTGGALTAYSAYAPQISDDGRFIVFNTRAVLSPADSLTNDDVYRVPNPVYNPADEVRSSVTYTLPAGVENLLLTGAVATDGTGNALDNVLTGNAANNVLTGGAGNDTLNGVGGNDTMVGGTGNDTFFRNVAGDVVTEAPGGGTDTVNSLVTYTLAANVENLVLNGAGNINGNGGSGNNILTGNAGNNVLDGKGGADTLRGLGGNDTLVWSSTDSYDGGTGTDVLKVLSGNLNLTTIVNTKILNVETIDMTGANNNVLTLNAQDVLDLSSTTNTLTVMGNAGDSVNIAPVTFTDLGVVGAFHKYTFGGATLLVDVDITNVA